MSKSYFKFLSVVSLLAVSIFVAQTAYAALSCSITTAAVCTASTTATTILRLNNASGGHVELAASSTASYGNSVVCCSVSGSTLVNSCSTGATSSVLWLAGQSNAHSSQTKTNANYTDNVCLSVPATTTVSVAYTTTDCTGYDATIASMSGTTNAHVGTSTVYTNKICGSSPSGAALVSATGTVTSSVFDATASSSYNSIMWTGTPGTGTVKFQFAAADSASGPWNYYGGTTCGALDWFVAASSSAPVELVGMGAQAPTCISNFNNKRYFRYKVMICSLDCTGKGSTSPVINKIVVNYAS